MITTAVLILAFVAGAYAEHALDLSGRVTVLIRRFQAWRRK